MNYISAFSSFSVDDLAVAEAFYRDRLGLHVARDEHGLLLSPAKQGEDHGAVFIYPKRDHTPAGHTVLNFVVGDLASEMDALVEHGIRFERLDDQHMQSDERGIHRGNGMAIAWLRDPAGNWISLIEATDQNQDNHA